MQTDPRVSELLEWSLSEGLPLPYSPETIIAYENQGCVVDLVTGAIVVGEADKPYIYRWTPAGEAFAHLVSVGLVEV